MDKIVDRLRRVLRLDPTVFTEIAADQSATGEGILVTAVAGLIGAITGSGNFFGRLIAGAIGGVVGLFIWTAVVLVVGKMFQGQGSYVQLLRVIGYAGAPLALSIIPVVGGLAGLAYAVVIQIRAIREVNRVSEGSAVATVLIPFAIVVVLLIILAVFAGLALLGFLSGVANDVG